MKVQNKDNKGNPYHSDANGQFTSKDGGGAANSNEELGDINFTVTKEISPNFKPKMSDEEYLSWLDSLDLYEEEVEEEQENKLKPVGEMSQEELLIEVGQRLDNLTKKNIRVSKGFFSNDLRLKCGVLRQIDTVIEKYGIDNFKIPYSVTVYNIAAPKAAHAFAERSCENHNEDYYLYRGLTPPKSGIINTRLRFNIGKPTNYENVVKKFTYYQQIGLFAETNEDFFAETTACHEMGHVLSHFIINQKLDKKIKSGILTEYSWSAFDDELLQIKNEIKTIFLKQNQDLTERDFVKETSKNGRKNNDEWFAEVFRSMNGGRPTKTALAMKQWLDEYFEFNGGNK